MDINMLLSRTINTLSQSHQANVSSHTGEIAINDDVQSYPSTGGREASPEEIGREIDRLNQVAKSVDNRVSFEYNEKTKRLVIRMTDPQTNEVVRQFPSKDMIRILENIHDMIGVFIDEQR